MGSCPSKPGDTPSPPEPVTKPPAPTCLFRIGDLVKRLGTGYGKQGKVTDVTYKAGICSSITVRYTDETSATDSPTNFKLLSRESCPLKVGYDVIVKSTGEKGYVTEIGFLNEMDEEQDKCVNVKVRRTSGDEMSYSPSELKIDRIAMLKSFRDKVFGQKQTGPVAPPNRMCSKVVRNWLDSVKDKANISFQEFQSIENEVSLDDLIACISYFKAFGEDINFDDSTLPTDGPVGRTETTGPTGDTGPAEVTGPTGIKVILTRQEIEDALQLRYPAPTGKVFVKRTIGSGLPGFDQYTFADFQALQTTGNKNDCLIHAILTAVSPTFRILSFTQKNEFADEYRRLHLPQSPEYDDTASLERLAGESFLTDVDIGKIGRILGVNIVVFENPATRITRDPAITEFSTDTSPTEFYMLYNPDNIHFETVRKPTNEYTISLAEVDAIRKILLESKTIEDLTGKGVDAFIPYRDMGYKLPDTQDPAILLDAVKSEIAAAKKQMQKPTGGRKTYRSSKKKGRRTRRR